MWLEWERVETDKIREVGKGQVEKGLVGQDEECVFYSKYSVGHWRALGRELDQHFIEQEGIEKIFAKEEALIT